MAQSVLYGVLQQLDIDPATPAIQVERDLIISSVQMTLEQHNAEIQQFGRLWHGETTDAHRRFKTFPGNELQPMDELADIIPVKGGGFYDTAFPLAMFGTGWGQTFIASKRMTLDQLSDNVNQMLQGDATTYRKMILSALLTNATYKVVDDDYGTLFINSLANGDAITYLDTTSDNPSAANHYSAQAAAIDDVNNPFPLLEAKLKQRPGNAGPYVALIASNLKPSVIGMDAFVSSGTSIVTPPTGTASTLNLPDGILLPPSATVIGGIDGTDTVVAEYPRLPNNIVMEGALGGPPPLLRRQYVEAELQGFQPVDDESDKFPFSKHRWFRAQGFGGWNRVGWVVHLIGSGAYAVPAGYGNPLGK